MLRITMNKSAAGAKKYYSEVYYSEGHAKGDYYSEKDQAIGFWGGKGAAKLGLEAEISKDDFAALCDNLNPETGKKLTERSTAERRVGYDFTFNASKSVTLAYTFGTNDEKKEILKAFGKSVRETMSEIETGVQTRVRVGGQNDNRETGNLVFGEFTHFTSRPIEDMPDPHLHTHCFVFNATYDNVEDKWKAAQFGQINIDAPYYEAVFHSKLADKLQTLGYGIEKTNNSFEIKGISRETTDKFSRRTEEIEHLAEEKNITNQEERAKLGARTRESKRNIASEEDQVKNWNERLTPDEAEGFRNLKGNFINDKDDLLSPVEYSLNHHLERKSVATDKEVLATALKSSVGSVSFENVKKEFEENEGIIKVQDKGQTYITTKEALAEENKLIAAAYESKGCFKPINGGYMPKEEKLNGEQRNAIKAALGSSDGIIIIAGKAGTGKTTLMKEVWQGIKEADKGIFAFAPSAEASRVVQRKEGFENAETVASLFHDRVLQDKIKNGVVWVDEAGMLSNKDMNRLLEITKGSNARLILTGDTKQHSSVERGDALRTLQQEAGISTIQVSKIQRQKNQQYKEAVFAISKDDIEKGFSKLEKMGVIKEIDDYEERLKTVANDYYTSAHGSKKQPKEVLVVSPTHIEGDKVTERIRARLKEENIIGTSEKVFQTFKNRQFTQAEKQSPEKYTAGNIIVFHQNAKGFKAGGRYEVHGIADKTVLLKDGEKTKRLPLDKASTFGVFEPKTIAVAKGDKIRITGNGKTAEGKHLFNGTTYKIDGFDREGNIKLSNGSTLPQDYGQFTLGYVMTSHASQGKSVDKVIISQSSLSLRAASKEQFYVSVSRGKQSVAIYTDNKKELLQAVSRSQERKSANELLKQNGTMIAAIENNRKGVLQRIKEKAIEAISRFKTDKNNEQLSRADSPKDKGKER